MLVLPSCTSVGITRRIHPATQGLTDEETEAKSYELLHLPGLILHLFPLTPAQECFLRFGTSLGGSYLERQGPPSSPTGSCILLLILAPLARSEDQNV